MNGIAPPSPHVTAGLPKNVREARSIASSSHFSGFGAPHPPAGFSASNVTRAPYGGSEWKSFGNVRSEDFGSGASLIDAVLRNFAVEPVGKDASCLRVFEPVEKNAKN